MKTLEDWWADAARELGVVTTADTSMLLDVARDVAHAVQRPAAPLTTYLMGLAVAGGADPAEIAARVSRLAASWQE